jgi:SAM-dependent methyltransferase
MEPLPDWAPLGLDLSTPSAARVYDYFLGGANNFGVDRELARRVLEVLPETPLVVQANRAFLHRAVRYLLEQGIRQFIDIGSGIPTVGNVHETAQRAAPESRVLYVDHDPVAVAHSELILGQNPRAKVLQADLRQPKDILESAQLSELIDLSAPIAVLMVAVLHFIDEHERPDDAIRRFRERLAPGSYLVISHATSDEQSAGTAESAAALYRSATDSVVLRTRERVRELFDGWDLMEPGVVWVPEWRPNWTDEVGSDPASSRVFAGVGRLTCR